VEKIKQYRCLSCDGTGQIDISRSTFSDGSPIYCPSGCPSCSGRGWVGRNLFMKQMASMPEKSNLEIVEFYDDAQDIQITDEPV